MPSEALGKSTLMAAMGKVRVHVVASDAIGIVELPGSQIWHLDVEVLRLQEMQLRRMMPLPKIKGESNPADLVTKHLPANLMEEHLARCGVAYCRGRAQAARGGCKGENSDWTAVHNTRITALFSPVKVPVGPLGADLNASA